MPTKELKWQSWGRKLQAYTYGNHLSCHCPHCCYCDENSFRDYFVGFAAERVSSIYGSGAGSFGVMIIECPKCFELSWQHFYESLPVFAAYVKNDFRKFKVPGALRAFNNMLKRAKGG